MYKNGYSSAKVTLFAGITKYFRISIQRKSECLLYIPNECTQTKERIIHIKFVQTRQ